MGSYKRWGKGGLITFLHPLATLLLAQPGMLFATLAIRAHCWLLVSLLSMETPRPLSTEWVPSQPVASLCHCKMLFLPRCGALHLSLNFVRFLYAYSSRLPRSLWVSALPSSTETVPPKLVPSANVMRVHSIFLSRSFTKIGRTWVDLY